MTERAPKILYNVAYGGKTALVPPHVDFSSLGRYLKAAGVDGISALPFRTRNIAAEYARHFSDIAVVEDAWNPGKRDNLVLAAGEGFVGAIRRRRGDMTEPPILQDTLLFPSATTSCAIVDELMREENRYFIAAHFESARYPRSHVHAQSDFRPHVMTVEEVSHLAHERGVQLWYDPKRLVDPRAAGNPGRNTPEHRAAALGEINRLGPQLAGVDIGSRVREDIEDLLEGRGFLSEVVQAAQSFAVAHQRIEIVIPARALLPFGANEDTYLKDIVDAIRGLAS